MDPVSAIGLVSSVVGIADIAVRTLQGLRTLQSLYNSADRRVAITRGNLQAVKCALEEIQEWAESLNDDAKTQYVGLLKKLAFAVECCAIPLEALCESIEGLSRKADGGGLTRQGKLAIMLGENELKEMSAHLGNQVLALNLLLTAAFCKTQSRCNAVLQDEDTRTILKQVQDDSASYVQREIETASVLTRRSIIVDNGEGFDSNFDFDAIVLDSQAYKHAFRTVLDERRHHRLHSGDAAVSKPFAGGSTSYANEELFGSTRLQEPSTSLELDGIQSSVRDSENTITNFVHDRRKTESESSTQPTAFSQRPPNYPSVPGFQEKVNSLRVARDLKANAVEQQPKTARPTRNREASLLSKMFGSVESAKDKAATLSNKKASGQRAKDQVQQRSEVKMLLLGAMFSGKSTMLKQLKLIHEGSWTSTEANDFLPIISNNIMQNVRALLEAMEYLELPLGNLENESHVETVFASPLECLDAEWPTQELRQAVQILWKDTGVQEAFRRSNEFQLDTNFSFWMDNMSRISQSDYVPSDKDILATRVRTTGITETTFVIGDLTYHVFDTGGARSERKKWIHCFNDVTMILFMVDISAYDLLLFEDETCNRMQEELSLFESICNSRWFTKTTIVLLFNKLDVFKKKLATSPLQKYFADYQGGQDYVAACDYIRHRFVSLNQSEARTIYTHFICAMDTTQMRFVMSAIYDVYRRI